MDMDAALNDLEASRAQVLQVQTEKRRLEEELEKSHSSLDSAEKQKSELQSQVLHLSHDLTRLEEALGEAAQEREEHKRKDEEMSEQIKKMEDVLEEELEQFERRLKDKDAEVDTRHVHFVYWALGCCCEKIPMSVRVCRWLKNGRNGRRSGRRK